MLIPFLILLLIGTQFRIAADDSVDPIDTEIRVIDSVKVSDSAKRPEQRDIVHIKNFPPFGKWMYQDDMEIAHWLGLLWEGKNLFEPINVIFVDAVSKTRKESIEALVDNLKKAGYNKKPHHSSGYIGFIGRSFYPQLPPERHHAFSDEVAEINNNHGRIFGPHSARGQFFYTGSFSREVIDPIAKIMHHYGSFDRARDELSQSLNKKSLYRITAFVHLENAIIADEKNTTGDHDGMAVVLSLLQSR